MKEHYCVTKNGECFILYETEDGFHVCPICGSAELPFPAYTLEGEGSFQICTCGFEFGFDDTVSASSRAVEGLENNWELWRKKVIKKSSYSKLTLNKCESNLKNIGISLAFDLMPIKNIKNT
jgi:hypothetical protein